MSETRQATLLVTGASGHLGRRVIELLLEAQAGPIVASTRTPDKLADFSARGVDVRQADFDDPASLAAAFAGVDRLLLISTDAVGQPGYRINQHVSAVKAAEAAGVKHVLYTSIVNPGPDTPVVLSADHLATETALEASSMGWTFLRNNIYADILPVSLNRALQMGSLYAAAADGKAAYITREDCARAAAAALADTFEGRRALDITGPEALSQADLASIASAIAGKPLTYVALPVETMIDNMVSAGLPRPAAAAYASFDQGIAEGKFDVVTSAVEELTGRQPMRIADFLAAERETLMQGL
ncbi:MAG: SDR family oxidoreductase [Anaerolineae bacterium]|nr:SDR family oxidoreductase [Anaerolineae bacterium]